MRFPRKKYPRYPRSSAKSAIIREGFRVYKLRIYMIINYLTTSRISRMFADGFLKNFSFWIFLFFQFGTPSLLAGNEVFGFGRVGSSTM